MRFLILLGLLVPSLAFGQQVTLKAFSTNDFATNGGYISVRTNRFPTFDQFNTNFFQSNNLSLSLNTNAGSGTSNYFYQLIQSNVVNNAQVWTNDAGVIHPVDLTLPLAYGRTDAPDALFQGIFSGTKQPILWQFYITNSGSGIRVHNRDSGANNADQSYAIFGLNTVPDNGNDLSPLSWDGGHFGLIGYADYEPGFLTNGGYAGVLGFNDSDSAKSYGVIGISVADVDGQTNVAVAGNSIVNGKTGVNVGGYFQIHSAAYSESDPSFVDSVLLLDNRDTSKPLLIGRTNGIEAFKVDSKGNLDMINKVRYQWPGTNLTAGQAFASDGGTPQQIYGVTLVSGTVTSFSAGNLSPLFNSTVATATTTPALSFAPISQSDNKFYVGPISGASAAPTFRSMDAADIPVTSSAGVTLTTNSGVLNIAGGISGTLNQVAKFTPSGSQIGDSIVSEAATNQWEWRSRTSASAWTNAITNRVFGSVTSSNNWLSLDFISPATKNTYAEITENEGSGNTDVMVGLQLNKAWTINGVGTVAAGGHNGDLFPAADNAIKIGNSSLRVLSVNTGPAGYLASDAASTTAGTLSAATYSQSMSSSGITYILNSGPNVIGGWQRESSFGQYGLQIGSSACLGFGSGTLAWDTFIIRGAVANQFAFCTNNGGASAPPAVLLHGSKATGTDHQGGNFTLAGGPSTGTGRGGDLALATCAKATSTGASANSFRTNFVIAATPVTLTESSATLVFNIALAASKVIGVTIDVTTTADDGTDFQTVHEQVPFTIVNKAGAMTIAGGTPAMTATAQSSGTLTTAWTAVANGATVDFKCNAVSSLTQTTLQIIGGYAIHVQTTGTSLITTQ